MLWIEFNSFGYKRIHTGISYYAKDLCFCFDLQEKIVARHEPNRNSARQKSAIVEMQF